MIFIKSIIKHFSKINVSKIIYLLTNYYIIEYKLNNNFF